MSITLVNVTCQANRPNGFPMSGAIFKFILSEVDSENGVIVPQEVTAIADANGHVVVQLWPNGMGRGGTNYRVMLTDLRTSPIPITLGVCIVPPTDCILGDILDSGTIPTIDLVTARANSAAEYASAAYASAQEAAASATSAAASATDAAQSAVIASSIVGNPYIVNVYNNISTINAVGADIANVNTVAGDHAAIAAILADKTNLDTVAGNIANVAAVGGSIANVNTVAADHTAIATVAADHTIVNTVASNISNVNAVGGNIANIATVAGATSNVAAVASNISAVAAVGADLTNVNLVAGDLTNINTTVANLTAINAAPGSATSAASSATSASGSASTATTQAGIATTQAGIATTQAGIATTQAGIATTKAGEASTSASTTAALLAAFQSVFLGKFVDDTAANAFADSHSITLVDGVMYENTTGTNKFRIYDGSAWQNYDSSAAASQSAAALSATNAAASAASAASSATTATGVLADPGFVSVKNNIGNFNTVATSITNINNVAGDLTNINTVAADKANIDIVAGDHANIVTVASDHTNIANIAGALTAINSVSANAANITTVATDRANIDIVAGDHIPINIVAGDHVAINTVANDHAAINVVASDHNNIIAALADHANIAAVAGDLTNIDTVSTNISSVNTAAANITDINNAAGNAATATSAANAANISAIAATDRATAAATILVQVTSSADSAAASAATATTQANTATTQATNSAISAGQALAIYGNVTTMNNSVTAAANSASTATIQASTATTQAGIAATQAGNAATSATAAANSATAAAGSASSALAIYGNTAAMNTAVSTSTTNAATATTQAGIATTQATAAAASAASAAAIVTGVSSNRPSVRPSLLIDFAAMGKLDPRITFGRSSPAMAYDGKTTVKAEENLVLYSQDLTNAGVWGKTNTTVTGNAAVAPDGTTTAGSVIETTASAPHYVGQGITAFALAYTFSVFLKKGDGATAPDWVRLHFTSASTGYANFNLSTGVVGKSGSGATASISYVGNGWYRCSITATPTAGSLGAYVVFNANTDADAWGGYAGLTTSNVFVWGAQLEQRAYATAYTPTTTAAITNYIPALQSYAANVARFDVNPVTGESLGLMVEEQRTNLLSFGQNFNDPTWIKTYAAVLDNCVIAPDGTTTASKLYETTQSIGIKYHSIYKIGASSVTGTYTLSVYAKAAERTFVWLSPGGSGANSGVFNLSNGTVTTNGSTTNTIVAVGNGWYRCTSTVTVSAANVYGYVGVASNSTTIDYLGDGYSGIYIWGAQLEAGAFATSYIPTLLTYSGRGSIGTYIGDNGLIQTAQANVARYQRNIAGAVQLLLEGAGSNFATNTQRLNVSTWTQNTGTVCNPNVVIAPDGSFTGQALYAIGSGSHWTYQSQSGASAGQQYTLSAYFKKGSTQYACLVEGGDTSWHNVYVDLNAGTVTGATNGTGTITYINNGWYRVTLTITRTNSGNFYIGASPAVASTGASIPNFAAAGTEFVYVWGFQCEAGAVATSYIPSTDTFTSRAGSASYYDSGTTALAEQNLLPYSQQVGGVNWTNQACTTTLNNATAPNGNTVATLVALTAGSGQNATQQNMVLTSGQPYVYSVYLKSGTQQFVQIAAAADGNIYANFDIVNGTAGNKGSNVTSSAITSVGNGWYRCSLVITSVVSTSTSFVLTAVQSNTDARWPTWTAAGTETYYAWGAQIENRTTLTDYTPTTTAAITNYIPRLLTAPSGLARYDFDPVTRLSKGLLLEAAGTNLFTYSSDLTNAAWGIANGSIGSNVVIAPDGTLTADKITEDATNSTHQLNSSAITWAGSTTYTTSFYAKAGGRNRFTILFGTSGNWSGGYRTATFDLSTGTVVAQDAAPFSASITPVGNGWYRCSITATTTGSPSASPIYLSLVNSGTTTGYQGDGWSGIYAWGFQLETGSVATSYIPTTTASVTRVADVGASVANSRAADVWSSAQATRSAEFPLMTGTNFSSWYRQDEGTMYIEAEMRQTLDSSTNFHMWYMDANSSDYMLSRVVGSTGKNQSYGTTGAGAQWNAVAASANTRGAFSKTALGFKANDIAYSSGTDALMTDSSAVLPVNTRLILGNGNATGYQALNGCIRRIAFFPKRLSNSEIQGLTF